MTRAVGPLQIVERRNQFPSLRRTRDPRYQRNRAVVTRHQSLLLPTVADRARAGVGLRVRTELAVKLGEQRDVIGEPQLRTVIGGQADIRRALLALLSALAHHNGAAGTVSRKRISTAGNPKAKSLLIYSERLPPCLNASTACAYAPISVTVGISFQWKTLLSICDSPELAAYSY